MKKMLILSCLLMSVLFSQELGEQLQKLTGGRPLNEKKYNEVTVISVVILIKNDLSREAGYFLDYFAVQARDSLLSPFVQIEKMKNALTKSTCFTVRNNVLWSHGFYYNNKIIAIPVERRDDAFLDIQYPKRR